MANPADKTVHITHLFWKKVALLCGTRVIGRSPFISYQFALFRPTHGCQGATTPRLEAERDYLRSGSFPVLVTEKIGGGLVFFDIGKAADGLGKKVIGAIIVHG